MSPVLCVTGRMSLPETGRRAIRLTMPSPRLWSAISPLITCASPTVCSTKVASPSPFTYGQAQSLHTVNFPAWPFWNFVDWASVSYGENAVANVAQTQNPNGYGGYSLQVNTNTPSLGRSYVVAQLAWMRLMSSDKTAIPFTG
jgi:hypothetical protein